ncbi:hypothetical protein OQA88_4441 [Cercophora sp. LCS_1]
MFSASKKDFKKASAGAESYWDRFAATSPPEDIAKQLLQDVAQLDAGGLPSQLAMHTPIPSSRAALQIATYLTPSPQIPEELKRFLYEKTRTRLRRVIEQGELVQEPPLPADGYLTTGDFTKTIPLSEGKQKIGGKEKPTKEEAETALKVLRFLTLDMSLPPNNHLHTSIKAIEDRFGLQRPIEDENASDVPTVRWSNDVKKYHDQRPPTRLRVCYICRFLLTDPHPRYGSMCRPCGAFNFAGSALSLPKSLKLRGRTALVTGARVNLGYSTTLRLLRCGATVIATTRYPNDAATRYSQEPDFGDWQTRLKVIGADFRSARDAFALVSATRAALGELGASKLDVLINNAAQTLTDSIKKEEHAVFRERQKSTEAAATDIVFQSAARGSITHHYQARIRGGVSPLALSSSFYGGDEHETAVAVLPPSEDISTARVTLPTSMKDDGRTDLLQPYFKSSWVQTVSEIPYEDIVSAHAVNAFVPLILFRELLPLMGADLKASSNPAASTADQAKKPKGTQPKPRKPLGYIINVSSREGLFERAPDHSAKTGVHVHTNMTKAAVNMITQTEAASAWRTRGVAMNTVDPGFMSAAPEMDALFGGVRPLDWEDGAGRVLWPVAIGEVEGSAVWGRFLKHYGAIDVDLV